MCDNMTLMTIQLRLRRRYTTGGVVKKNTVKGNGDSGNHKRRKLSAVQKNALPAQARRELYIDKNGHRRFRDAV